MPRRSILIFLSSVACLFAAVGAGNNLYNIDHTDGGHLTVAIISSAVVAIGWAWFASTRGLRGVLLMAIATPAFFTALNRLYPLPHRTLTSAQLHNAVIIHAILINIFIVLGYSLVVLFARAEGRRFFAAHTEIELASRIQRRLVPPLSVDSAAFEAHGRSLPSGTVGGDLLDIVDCRNASLAYVADVAGHGVNAGVLMSMLKASVRTRFAASGVTDEGLLECLNNVLYPLTDTSSYATFAFVCIEKGKPLRFSLAGHLPILHLKMKCNQVEECAIANFPVGMFPAANFKTGEIVAEPGDLIAIVTDGLTETTNKAGNEIGCRYIQDAMRQMSSHPLDAIADRVFEQSESFGKPADDRTLLLIRVR